MSGTGKSLRVLVAPLDWGLGHATRCIPIIGEILHLGFDVVLAAEGPCAQILAREFPQLEIKRLPGYNIRYGKKRLILNLLLQLPRIFKTIRKEHQWLDKLLQTEHFDVVISDNRPGLWNKSVHSIYITHQLRVLSRASNLVDNMLQHIHNLYIKQFNEVWVPDVEDSINAAGVLAHPSKLLVQPLYIGLISRMQEQQAVAKVYDLMILLSGPEPQRSLLEKQLLTELSSVKMKTIVVRGLPGNDTTVKAASHVDVFNHLTSVQLQHAFHQSEFVICRSGYTTIMDLLKLRKKAFLIPTPGQTEQEYLAAHMMQQGCFPFLKQEDFEISKAIDMFKSFHFRFPFHEKQFEQYRETVTSLASIPQKL